MLRRAGVGADPTAKNAATARATNERSLSNLGLLDTVLTPSGAKRKRVKGLRGAATPGQELETLLGS